MDWLLQWFKSESGRVLMPGFAPNRDEGGEGGFEEGGDGGGFDGTGSDSDDEGGTGTGQEPVLDDAKVRDYLKGKGIEVDDFAKLAQLNKSHSSLTTKHQSLTDSMKALRIALGDSEFDSLLAAGTRKMAGEGDEDDFGRDVGEPAHFANVKPEVKQQMQATFDYYFQRVLPGMTQSIIKGVLRSIEDRDYGSIEEKFAEENEDYDDFKEAMEALRHEHGITGKSRRTLERLLKMAREDAEAAAKEMGGGSVTTRVKGRPQPKGGSRGAIEEKKPTTLAEKDEAYRKRWEKEHQPKG